MKVFQFPSNSVQNISLCTFLLFWDSEAFPSSPVLNWDTSTSLSHLLSSPERYAKALNRTVEQVLRTKETYAKASEDLHQLLQSPDMTGSEKHQIMCRHRYQYGRHPFTCRECWSYLPVCICSEVGPKQELPSNLQVIVWTHHREWGLTSNTGCILARTFKDCSMLMKGLPEHDRQLEGILSDQTALLVVLWPEDDTNSKRTKKGRLDGNESISMEAIRDEISHHQRRVVIIAVDGTWRNARRMVARLPEKVRRLDLEVDLVLPMPARGKRESILAPLRSRGPAEVAAPGTDEVATAQRQVCTAEAVIGTLVALGLPYEVGERVRSLTKIKVDLIGRYRGKVNHVPKRLDIEDVSM